MNSTKEIHTYKPQYKIMLANGEYILRETENEAITDMRILAANGVECTLESIES